MNLQEYMQPYHPYFWKWDDDGTVIEITKGNTVAYRKLIEEIMLGLSGTSLPPFGSLLLIILATNADAKGSLLQIEKALPAKCLPNNLYIEACSVFKMLSQLPNEYKIGKNRQYLIKLLLEKAHNKLSIRKSEKIIDLLKAGSIDWTNIIMPIAYNEGVFRNDFKTLALIGRRFTSAREIIDTMVAEIPELGEEMILPLTGIEGGDFVEELKLHYKTNILGVLIKPFQAGFTIPMNNTSSTTLQFFGGIADLTNKGDFDRLLLSEHAYDELTFLSRLANNESLYLLKEVPPSSDKKERILLIDISIMNWGVPKLLSLAGCIAMVKHPRSTTQATSYLVGTHNEKVSLHTVSDVVDVMNRTDAAINPVAGIKQLMEKKEEKKQVEIFLFTTEAVYKQVEMQQMIRESKSIRYLFLATATGNISLYQMTLGGRKLLQQINLNLEDLWKSKLSKSVSDNQVVASTNNFPILFPGPLSAKHAMKLGDNLFCVAQNRLFMQLGTRSKNGIDTGYLLLAEDLPVNGSFAVGKNELEEILFLSFNRKDKILYLTNIHTGKQVSGVFKKWKNSNADFFFYEGLFYHDNHHETIEIRTDEKWKELQVNILIKDFSALNKARQDVEAKLLRRINSKSILKNVSSVFINNVDNLVFNNHELRCMVSDVRVDATSFLQKQIEATSVQNRKNVFAFPDGSTVTVHPTGMFELQSSEESLPKIYLPSVINAAVALATTEYFTGNKYYQRSLNEDVYKEYSILLEKGGTSHQIIKIIKENTNLDLEKAKRLALGTLPAIIIEKLAKRAALRIVEEIKNAGGVAVTRPAVSVEISQRVISPELFNKRYLTVFVNQIKKYAASIKAP